MSGVSLGAMPARDVSQSDFATAVLERSKQVPVVVDFWAAWCGPCRVLGPILEKVAGEPDSGFELAKIDVDRNPALAGQFGVQSIPTVIAFTDGKPVARFTGAIPEGEVRRFVQGLRPSVADVKVAAAAERLEAGDAWTAEKLLREVLSTEPDHQAAALGLASLLIPRGDLEEAEGVLTPLPPGPEVNRVRAAIRLRGGAPDNRDAATPLQRGKALAAEGRADDALEQLLSAVAAAGEEADEARRSMLDLFEVLGPSHPLTVDYRRRLANALF